MVYFRIRIFWLFQISQEKDYDWGFPGKKLYRRHVVGIDFFEVDPLLFPVDFTMTPPPRNLWKFSLFLFVLNFWNSLNSLKYLETILKLCIFTFFCLFWNNVIGIFQKEIGKDINGKLSKSSVIQLQISELHWLAKQVRISILSLSLLYDLTLHIQQIFHHIFHPIVL